jgi:hypothetical protein
MRNSFVFCFVGLLLGGCTAIQAFSQTETSQALFTPSPEVRSITTSLVSETIDLTRVASVTSNATPQKVHSATNTPRASGPSAQLATEISAEPRFTPSTTPTPGHPSTPTQTAPVYENVETVQIISLCPEERRIPLQELGLDPRTRLLLLPTPASNSGNYVNGYWYLDPAKTEPVYISHLGLGATNTDFKTELYDYDVSPNGRWVSYIRAGEKEERQMVWISSINGQETIFVKEISKYAYPKWVNDQEIVIIGSPYLDESGEIYSGGGMGDYMPLLSINPFNGREQVLLPLPEPEMGYYSQYLINFLREGIDPYALYYEPDNDANNFKLFNYTTNISQQVFSWLEPYIKWNNFNIYQFEDNDFHISVMDGFRLSISPLIEFETLPLSCIFNDVMRQIQLPEQFGELYVINVAKKGDIFILGEFGSVDVLEDDFLFSLDTTQNEFRDYCMSVYPSARINPSPDGRYLAITNYTQPGVGIGHSWVNILDLETGYYAEIDGFQMIGWGFEDD